MDEPQTHHSVVNGRAPARDARHSKKTPGGGTPPRRSKPKRPEVDVFRRHSDNDAGTVTSVPSRTNVLLTSTARRRDPRAFFEGKAVWRRVIMLTVLLVVIHPPPARAVFHIARISEVMSGVGANPTVQYVEIRMTASFQNAVANSRITAFNCTGTTATVLLVVPGNVTNQGAGVTWIVGSQSFAAASGIAPDFTWDTTTVGSIPTACGMVCFGAPGIVPPNPSTWSASDPNQYVDCVAYGNYTGPTKTSTHDTTPTSGTPTGLPAGDGVHSLTRSTDTGNNTNDFVLACPSPTNNAGTSGSFGSCTPPTTTTSTTHSTSTSTSTSTSSSTS